MFGGPDLQSLALLDILVLDFSVANKLISEFLLILMFPCLGQRGTLTILLLWTKGFCQAFVCANNNQMP